MQEDALSLKLVRKEGLTDVIDRLEEGVGEVGSGPICVFGRSGARNYRKGFVFDELGEIPHFHRLQMLNRLYF